MITKDINILSIGFDGLIRVNTLSIAELIFKKQGIDCRFVKEEVYAGVVKGWLTINEQGPYRAFLFQNWQSDSGCCVLMSVFDTPDDVFDVHKTSHNVVVQSSPIEIVNVITDGPENQPAEEIAFRTYGNGY